MPTDRAQHRFRIELQGVGKRFARHWIIQDLSTTFQSGTLTGIKGRNGSGKSTLLRLLCGQLTPSRGNITFALNGQPVPVSQCYRLVSWTGPYLEIIEELTIAEFLRFHFTMKPLLPELELAQIPALLELDQVRNRKLSDCSSGMRQRVLLGSALYADTPLLLLDEPTVTLDAEAIDWFHTQLNTYGSNRLVVIASNDPEDLRSCSQVIVL